MILSPQALWGHTSTLVERPGESHLDGEKVLVAGHQKQDHLGGLWPRLQDHVWEAVENTKVLGNCPALGPRGREEGHRLPDIPAPTQ